MKKGIILLVYIISLPCFAQLPCVSPTRQAEMDANSLRCRVLTGGEFGWNLNNAVYHPEFIPGNNNPSTIFLAGLWYGGLDPEENIRLRRVSYRSSGSSFYSGPLNTVTGEILRNDCQRWDRSFSVTAEDIRFFLEDLDDGTLDTLHPNIMGWPGTGNPHFGQIYGFSLPNQELAPFFDANSDGIYTPLQGDFPVVSLQGLPKFVPDKQIWMVINDQGGGAIPSPINGLSLPAEIQIQYFAFHCPEKPYIHRSMFTSHKLIYRGLDILDSFALGMSTDFDLGCYIDDYLGSDTSSHTFYVYNRSPEDMPIGSCSSIPVFGENPPVQAVSFLSHSLDGFMPIYNEAVGSPRPATTDPQNALESFRFLHSRWRDNSPLYPEKDGYSPASPLEPVKAAFPNSPLDTGGWSMYRESIASRDVRGLGIHHIGTLHPGDVIELVTAWTYHRQNDAGHLGNVEIMSDEISEIRTLYQDGFNEVCQIETSLKNQKAEPPIRIWPQPASDVIHVHLNKSSRGRIQIFDAYSRMVSHTDFEATSSVSINVQNLQSGMYFMQLNQGDVHFSKCIVITKY